MPDTTKEKLYALDDSATTPFSDHFLEVAKQIRQVRDGIRTADGEYARLVREAQDLKAQIQNLFRQELGLTIQLRESADLLGAKDYARRRKNS